MLTRAFPAGDAADAGGGREAGVLVAACDPARAHDVFLCDTPGLFGALALWGWKVGGVTQTTLAGQLFIRPYDIERGVVFGGQGEAKQGRSLTYFIAHESAHDGRRGGGGGRGGPLLSAGRSCSSGRARWHRARLTEAALLPCRLHPLSRGVGGGVLGWGGGGGSGRASARRGSGRARQRFGVAGGKIASPLDADVSGGRPPSAGFSASQGTSVASARAVARRSQPARDAGRTSCAARPAAAWRGRRRTGRPDDGELFRLAARVFDRQQRLGQRQRVLGHAGARLASARSATARQRSSVVSVDRRIADSSATESPTVRRRRRRAFRARSAPRDRRRS